jgi:hypothetical protein
MIVSEKVIKPMARIKYDGVIEAVRYAPDGKVSIARAYERRGPAFSDRILLNRNELIRRLDAGEKFVVGKRVPNMGASFDVSARVYLLHEAGNVFWITTQKPGTVQTDSRDEIEGAPIF